MRLHTNKVLPFSEALTKADEVHGTDLYFATFSDHRSTKRKRAYEVKLVAHDKQPGDGRRKANSGNYGAGPDWAATFEEWGYFLKHLFAADPRMTCDWYDGEEAFHWNTYGQFLTLEEMKARYPEADPFPYVETNTRKRGGGRAPIRRDQGALAGLGQAGNAYWKWDPRY